MSTADLINPILNSPYYPPEAHFELGSEGPTGTILPGRRPSESFIPLPVSKKGGAHQQARALRAAPQGFRTQHLGIDRLGCRHLLRIELHLKR